VTTRARIATPRIATRRPKRDAVRRDDRDSNVRRATRDSSARIRDARFERANS
jgi:hypothetical protein